MSPQRVQYFMDMLLHQYRIEAILSTHYSPCLQSSLYFLLLELTFIFFESPTQRLDTSGDRFDMFRRLAMATHGDLLVVNKSDVATVMTEVLSNYNKMENVVVRYKFNCSDLYVLSIPTGEDVKILLTIDKNEGNPTTFIPPYVVDLNGENLTETSSGTYYSFYILPNTTVYVRVISQTPGLICSLRAFVSSARTMLLSYTDNPLIDIGDPVRYAGIPQLATGLPIGYPEPVTIVIQPIDSTTGSPFQEVTIGSPDVSTNSQTVSSTESTDSDPEGQCPQMNVNALADPRQHAFKQVIQSVLSNPSIMCYAFRFRLESYGRAQDPENAFALGVCLLILNCQFQSSLGDLPSILLKKLPD
ncbi:unnamed protein product [Haemonchus placei]|uniref:Ras-associating domain-containing protein n=1 Tax=Haemonchus placei TaxID=6290 RepID=A0A0N4X4E9_HAEPC|nr:unnamed protein product [Haemonchus placei]